MNLLTIIAAHASRPPMKDRLARLEADIDRGIAERAARRKVDEEHAAQAKATKRAMARANDPLLRWASR